MFDSLLNFLQFSNLISFFIKIFGIALSGMYILFTGIVIRQVRIMRKAIEVNDNSLLIVAAYIEFGLSLFVFLYSLLIL